MPTGEVKGGSAMGITGGGGAGTNEDLGTDHGEVEHGPGSDV